MVNRIAQAFRGVQLGRSLAQALKGENPRRVDGQSSHGHVAYASLTARKPA